MNKTFINTETIENILAGLNIPKELKGFSMLATAILFTAENSQYEKSVVCTAENFATTPKRAEDFMKNAIESAARDNEICSNFVNSCKKESLVSDFIKYVIGLISEK
ncbi:MAG: sporulation initiation factor Spo0A C-terminal domain-containing protein [Ruminococcus sp.]